MKATIWEKKTITIYIGGDPEKGNAPVFTLELANPQILMDTNTDKITIIETK